MDKKELDRRAKELVKLAKAEAKKHATQTELNNAIFGKTGLASVLFPTQKDREIFGERPEWREVQNIIEALPRGRVGVAKPDDPSGTVSVRMPKSLHRALILEAEAEGTSLNQLMITKLAVGLREAVER